MPHNVLLKGVYDNRLYYLLLCVLALVSTGLLWHFSNNQQVGDSLGIAYYVSVGKDISNPHHLLYGPIVWVIYQFVNLFTSVDVLAAGQMHNILWAVVCVVSLAALVRHYTQNAVYAFLSGLALLLSHQFWQYSTQFEVYVPALGCLALLIYLLIKASSKPLTTGVIVYSIVLLFFSICYHQMGVLFLLPLALLLYWQWGSKGFKGIAIIATVTGALCIAAYLAVYFIMYGHEASLTGFMKYCVIYAYSNPDWGTFSHFTKAEEVARIFDNVTGSFLAPYRAAKVPVMVAALSFLVVVLWNILAIIKKWAGAPLRALILLWLAVYFLFLLWWTPGYEFFVMLTWPILMLLLLSIYDVAKLIGKPLLVPAIVGVAAVGALGKMNAASFKYYHYEHDEGYYKAAEAIKLAGTDCWVVSNFNIMLNLKYFHNFHQSIESDGVAIDYYYRDSVPAHSTFKDMPCVLIEMWYYNPWYGPMGENGFSKPEQWLQLNNNLFRFETDSSGKLLATATFDVLEGEGRAPYLYVDRTQVAPIDGYLSFFAKLDSLTTLRGQEKDVSYLNWYEQHKGLLAK